MRRGKPETPKDPRRDIFAGGSEMGRLMATIDWGATSIGPLDRWLA